MWNMYLEREDSKVVGKSFDLNELRTDFKPSLN